MTDSQDRIEDVEQEIKEARTRAEDDGLIPDPDHEQRFYESGEGRARKDARDDEDEDASPG
jgi:hypothetical protein